MKRKLSTNHTLLIYGIICFSITTLVSCNASKKMRVKKLVSSAQMAIEKDEAHITVLSLTRDLKLSQEKIDTTINNRIIAKLHSYQKVTDSAKAHTAAIANIFTGSTSFRRGYKNIFELKKPSLDKYISDSAIRYYRFKMIEDGLSVAEKKLYQMAAFFGPGIYKIPLGKVDLADSMFMPIIDSLIYFSNKYSQISQTGDIVIDGYADGMDITPDSELYGQLLAGLKKSSATKEELNSQLSQLRAGSIGNLLHNLVVKNKSQFKSWSTFDIMSFEYGQGETLPTKTIKDYTEDDDRRRVVLIYWCVLPND
ncbi:MAG: hypothetical protein ABI237_07280 [Ginsengibacter sp.]